MPETFNIALVIQHPIMYSPDQMLALYEQKFNHQMFKDSPVNLYQPIQHIMEMKGKRIRPLLLLLSTDMFGGKVEQSLYPAYAMEVFHNFTLVHDDIMDHADIRRGLPTVHKKFGLNAGILSGDAMLAYTYKYLAQIPSTYLLPALTLFNNTAIEIIEGQQMDMDFENRNDVTENEYLQMIGYKTSVLLACSLQLGAILAGADEPNQKLIYDFGLNLGLSFQIKDDYLDSFGDGDKVGKRIGGDILQNKKTLLYITAMNQANTTQRTMFEVLLTQQDEAKKIAEVKQLFVETGARQLVMEKAEVLFEQSLESLNKISLPADNKSVLLEMAHKINNREN